MSKAVLVSIRPSSCNLIECGARTIEVRRERPAQETPFKCYIYCTNRYDEHCVIHMRDGHRPYFGNGKVIGEFTCDKIDVYNTTIKPYGVQFNVSDKALKRMCLSRSKLIEYGVTERGKYAILYGWHISNLVIYDIPKGLAYFTVNRYSQNIIDNGKIECRIPKYLTCGLSWCCSTCIYGAKKQLTKPPKRHCYVEELL